MSFLKNFFKIGNYTDRQIAEAAAVYYGIPMMNEKCNAYDHGINQNAAQPIQKHNATDDSAHSYQEEKNIETDNEGAPTVIELADEIVNAEHDGTETGNNKQETQQVASNAFCDTCVPSEVPEVKAVEEAIDMKPEPASKNRKRKEAPKAADHKVSGFDVNAFVKHTDVQEAMPMQQPSAQPQQQVLFPENYSSMSATDKCTVIKNIVNNGVLPPVYDPKPAMSPEQKKLEVQKHITFIPDVHKGVEEIQLMGLLKLIKHPLLKREMEKNGSVDRPNDPKLQEVPLALHAKQEQIARYDMAFEIRLKDREKVLVVLFSTVPVFNSNTGTWDNAIAVFPKDKGKPANKK